MILEGAFAGFVGQGQRLLSRSRVSLSVFSLMEPSLKNLWDLKLSAPNLELGDKRLKLLEGSEDAGYVTSVHKIPWSDETIAFGIVRKPRYESGQKLSIESTEIQAEVIALPNTFDIKKKPVL